MNSKLIPVAEITTTAVKLLCKELGPVNTARFINQFTSGTGDYTRDRDCFVADLSVTEIVAQMKKKAGNEDS